MTDNFRFAAVSALLALTAIFLSIRDHDEITPARAAFSSFPLRIGTWIGSDLILTPDELQTLGQGDFLNREYHDSSTDSATVDLFAAYLPSQRTGDTLHSPKNCLPGSGWLPVQSSNTFILLSSENRIPVNRYVVAKGDRRGLVLYWYLSHGRAVSNEYLAKYELVRDSIRFHRSDGAIIRVATEIKSFETPADAERRLVSLLNIVVPILAKYIPR